VITTATIRVLIVDDHPVVREGLRRLISTEPGIEVVGEAADGDEAIALANATHPDVVLLDLMMPHKDGIVTTAELKRALPDVRVLVLTSYFEDQWLFPAIKAGAIGYLLKDSAPAELVAAIRRAADGEASLHPAIARKLLHELSQPAEPWLVGESLTGRETEVLNLVARGMSNQDIAERLVLSERTARSHVSSILRKLHLASRTQAALYAVRKGLVKLDN
jgi:NarL family two-component system response regulator LiaR